MEKAIYCLSSFLFGGAIFSFVTYICLKNRYAVKEQKKQIGSFIKGMKELKKAEKTANIEKSIYTFAKRCLNFHAESFNDFNMEAYNKIAYALSTYENQKYPYPSNSEDGMMPVYPISTDFGNCVSEEETLNTICKNLHEIIGIN